MLEEAEEDVLAFYAFPAEHWRKLRSTDESVKGHAPSERSIPGNPSAGRGPRRAAGRLLWPRDLTDILGSRDLGGSARRRPRGAGGSLAPGVVDPRAKRRSRG